MIDHHSRLQVGDAQQTRVKVLFREALRTGTLNGTVTEWTEENAHGLFTTTMEVARNGEVVCWTEAKGSIPKRAGWSTLPVTTATRRDLTARAGQARAQEVIRLIQKTPTRTPATVSVDVTGSVQSVLTLMLQELERPALQGVHLSVAHAHVSGTPPGHRRTVLTRLAGQGHLHLRTFTLGMTARWLHEHETTVADPLLSDLMNELEQHPSPGPTPDQTSLFDDLWSLLGDAHARGTAHGLALSADLDSGTTVHLGRHGPAHRMTETPGAHTAEDPDDRPTPVDALGPGDVSFLTVDGHQTTLDFRGVPVPVHPDTSLALQRVVQSWKQGGRSRLEQRNATGTLLFRPGPGGAGGPHVCVAEGHLPSCTPSDVRWTLLLDPTLRTLMTVNRRYLNGETADR